MTMEESEKKEKLGFVKGQELDGMGLLTTV